jgi:catechol 2,3-dioxygenase-like lactoylglutathione lyase family enzyme
VNDFLLHHVNVNVDDLDAAVAFYSKMFATEPAKLRPGYANFAIDEPPLKLVLFEGDRTGTINHLGVEVDDEQEVLAAEARLRGDGLTTSGVTDTVCCYAAKTETWLDGPDGTKWEWYVKHSDVDTAESVVVGQRRDGLPGSVCRCD